MKSTLLFVFVAFALAPISAARAQQLKFTASHTQSCLRTKSDPNQMAACVGVSANKCMEDTEGGMSTVGMGGCINAELKFWDEWLNGVYKALLAQEKADDAEIGAGDGSVPAKAAALRDMQRAWLPWRDATCDYERSLWGGGTGGGPATLGCLMRLTASQVFYLESRFSAEN